MKKDTYYAHKRKNKKEINKQLKPKRAFHNKTASCFSYNVCKHGVGYHKKVTAII